MFDNIDYYEVLEVSPKASPEVIQNAYRALVKKYHPDIFKGDKNVATKMMSLINNAYTILSDQQKRKQYDEYYSNKNTQQTHNSRDEEITPEMRQILIARNRAIKNNEQILDNPKISLYTFNGIGVTFLDEENYDAYSNTFIFGHWFTFLYLPIIRLGRYRVIKKGSSYLIISKITSKQSVKEILKSYFSQPRFILCLIIVSIIAFNIAISSKPTSTQQSQPSKKEQTTAQQPVISFIPKTSILTQYVPNEPLYNNDGNCKITIDNKQNSFPVVIRIWNISTQPKAVRTLTIKQGEQFAVENLTPGTYEIRYMNLYENSQSKDVFKSQQFSLSQHEVQDGVQFDNIRFTLYKVSNGNAKTYPITASEL